MVIDEGGDLVGGVLTARGVTEHHAGKGRDGATAHMGNVAGLDVGAVALADLGKFGLDRGVLGIIAPPQGVLAPHQVHGVGGGRIDRRLVFPEHLIELAPGHPRPLGKGFGVRTSAFLEQLRPEFAHREQRAHAGA